MVEQLNSTFLLGLHLTNTKYEFTEKIYDDICKIKYSQMNEYLGKMNKNYKLQSNDEFIIFKYVFHDNSIENITTNYYLDNQNCPFHIDILDESLVCDFLHPESLKLKLTENNKRYYGLELVYNNSTLTTGHSVLFVFDTFLNMSYIIDSNYNNDFFDNIVESSNCINEVCKYYSSLIEYDFIDLHSLELAIDLNKRCYSQKPFFKGYCRAYTLLFQYLIMTDDDLDIIELLEKLNSMDIEVIMDMVENFHPIIHKLIYEKT